MIRFRPAFLVFIGLASFGCGASAASGSSGNTLTPEPPARVVQGQVSYEARHPTPSGTSLAVQRRPARRVTVWAVAEDGSALAETRTDDAGRYSLRVPGRAVAVVALARIDDGAIQLVVSPNADGAAPHRFGRPVAEIEAGILDLPIADDAPGGPAGAFHILDSLLRGSRTVHEWTGRDLPPFFAYWGRGVTHDWSYYHGEQPADSGRYGIELLGGEPDAWISSDTDEHDEAIVLHEFGHFVMDRLTTDSSAGGDHGGGALIESGLAWEEGRASFFGVAVLGAPFYRDTIGREPGGSTRVNDNFERRGSDPHGPGSEIGVAEVLWDLADGAGGLPDEDHDGVALGPAAVLQAMIDIAARPGAFPAVDSFLRFLIDDGRVSLSDMKHMLVVGDQPMSMIPPAAETYPFALSLGTPRRGHIDSLSNPAPSGGPARRGSGYDAVRTYRVHVPSSGRLYVYLDIEGTGRGADHQDLDLELRDIRASLLASSRDEKPGESIAQDVQAGDYIVQVRGGGQGNRADYQVSARLE
ncbi:MAG: hypothetical protein GXP55_14085 [Deltaproteobacteria bacterium]|nr:hypothetical protein [Deltaproteobacteria bacterium]